MRVKCINNKNAGYYLTLGKIYDAIKVNEVGDYYIKDNTGFCNFYYKYRFKPLSEIRNEKIDKLLEDESSMYKE